MAKKDFERAFSFIIQAEGDNEFTNDPRDPGGPTRYGVSWGAVRLRDADKDGHLDFDLDHDGDVDEWDIRLVTRSHAKMLFNEDYWSPCRCDALPPPLSLAVADAAYNQGPRTAVALLQKAVGVTPDGKPGPITLAAVEAADRTRLLGSYLLLRAHRYTQHPEIRTFGRGWMNRLHDVWKECMDG